MYQIVDLEGNKIKCNGAGELFDKLCEFYARGVIPMFKCPYPEDYEWMLDEVTGVPLYLWDYAHAYNRLWDYIDLEYVGWQASATQRAVTG